MAYDALNQYNWTDQEGFTYDQTKKHIDDYLSSIQQKLHEGIQIGEERGRAKIEIAKNLLKAGVSIDVISQATGLNADDIKKL